LKTRIYAHRGAAAYAPENTMPSFEMACEMGTDAFELDVHLTKDGKVVVIHDDTVDRTSNGSGAVSSMTYAELLEMDFSYGKEGFEKVRIPLLNEVFEFAHKNNIFVNVELKENLYQDAFPIIEKVLKIEKEYGMSENVIYSSFNHYLLRDLKKVSKNISTGLLYVGGLVDIWEYAKKLEAQAVHPHYSCLSYKNLVTECHSQQIAVNPWTVDSESDILEMLQSGVDGIISNKPDIVKKVCNQFYQTK